MPFQKGIKLPGQGGYRKNAGRKSEVHREITKKAAEIARDYIERSVKPVMATYFQLAHGRYVNKWHEGVRVGVEFEADPATTRHFVDKILPDEQETQQHSGITVNIGIVQQQRRDSAEPELRSNGLQIRLGGGNGANGNGSHSA